MSQRLTRSRSNKENQTPNKSKGLKRGFSNARDPVILEAEFDSQPLDDTAFATPTRGRKKRLSSVDVESDGRFEFKLPKSTKSRTKDASYSPENKEHRKSSTRTKKVLAELHDSNPETLSPVKNKKRKKLKVRKTMDLNFLPEMEVNTENNVKVQKEKVKKKKRNTRFLPKLDDLEKDKEQTLNSKSVSDSSSEKDSEKILTESKISKNKKRSKKASIGSVGKDNANLNKFNRVCDSSSEKDSEKMCDTSISSASESNVKIKKNKKRSRKTSEESESKSLSDSLSGTEPEEIRTSELKIRKHKKASKKLHDLENDKEQTSNSKSVSDSSTEKESEKILTESKISKNKKRSKKASIGLVGNSDKNPNKSKPISDSSSEKYSGKMCDTSISSASESNVKTEKNKKKSTKTYKELESKSVSDSFTGKEPEKILDSFSFASESIREVRKNRKKSKRSCHESVDDNDDNENKSKSETLTLLSEFNKPAKITSQDSITNNDQEDVVSQKVKQKNDKKNFDALNTSNQSVNSLTDSAKQEVRKIKRKSHHILEDELNATKSKAHQISDSTVPEAESRECRIKNQKFGQELLDDDNQKSDQSKSSQSIPDTKVSKQMIVPEFSSEKVKKIKKRSKKSSKDSLKTTRQMTPISISSTSDVIELSSDESDDVFSQEETFVTADDESCIKLSNTDEPTMVVRPSLDIIPSNDQEINDLNQSGTEDSPTNLKSKNRSNSLTSNSLSHNVGDVSAISAKTIKNRTPIGRLKRCNTFSVDPFDLSKSPSLLQSSCQTKLNDYEGLLKSLNNDSPSKLSLPKTKRDSNSLNELDKNSRKRSNSLSNGISKSMGDVSTISGSNSKSHHHTPMLTRSSTFVVDPSNFSKSPNVRRKSSLTKMNNKRSLSQSIVHEKPKLNGSQTKFHAFQVEVMGTNSPSNRLSQSMNDDKSLDNDSFIEMNIGLKNSSRMSLIKSQGKVSGSDSDISWHAPIRNNKISNSVIKRDSMPRSLTNSSHKGNKRVSEAAYDSVKKLKRGTFTVDELNFDTPMETNSAEHRTTCNNDRTSQVETSKPKRGTFNLDDGYIGMLSNDDRNSKVDNTKQKRGTFNVDDEAIEIISDKNTKEPSTDSVKKSKRETYNIDEVNLPTNKSPSKNTHSEEHDVNDQLNTTFGILEELFEDKKKIKSKLSNSLVSENINQKSPYQEESVLNNLNITLRNRKRHFSKTSGSSGSNQRDIFEIVESDPAVAKNLSIVNPDSVLISDSVMFNNRQSLFPETGKTRKSSRKTWNEVPRRSILGSSPKLAMPTAEGAVSSATESVKPSLGNQLVVPTCNSPGNSSKILRTPRKKWSIVEHEEQRRSRVSFMLNEDSLLNQSTNQSLIGEISIPSCASTPYSSFKGEKSLLKKVLVNTGKKDKILSKNLAATKGKMPDFAKIHKRAFEKMENIQEMRDRKAARAQFLLSGHKPADNTSLLHKSGAESRKQLNFNTSNLNKSGANKSVNLSKGESKVLGKKRNSLGKKDILSKPVQLLMQKHKRDSLEKTKETQQKKRMSLEKAVKKAKIQLQTKIPGPLGKTTHQAPIAKIPVMPKKPTAVKAIPKPIFTIAKAIGGSTASLKKDVRAALTKRDVSRIEKNIKAVTMKTKGDDSSIQDKTRDTVKGVRMNRRFELLMQMRGEKQK